MHYHNECPICYNLLNYSNKAVSICNHCFCNDCYEKINICALCRGNLNKPRAKKQIIFSILYFIFNLFKSSLTFLMELLISLSVITNRMNGYDSDNNNDNDNNE
jgi:hypothetical protein